MVRYNLNLNLGNEAFQTGKTITATEVVETCDSAELSREIQHLAEVVNARTAKFVLDNTLAAVLQKLSEGKAVVFTLDGKAALRIYPDVHLKAGSINLAKARELDPTVTDLTLENISAIAQKAGGVVVRAKAECEQVLTDRLRAAEGLSLHMESKVEKPYVARVSSNGNGGSNGGNNGGNSEEIG